VTHPSSYRSHGVDAVIADRELHRALPDGTPVVVPGPVSSPPREAAIALDRVTKRFPSAAGATYTAVEDVSLAVPEGRFVALVGPSGCGKSTILNLAAGLLSPSEGAVVVHGEPLAGLNPKATYLFQQDGLLPWKTVLDNVALGLVFRGWNRRAARDLAGQWLERVGLGPFAAHFPHQLSGGMRKRVAIAQSWIVDPDILLMDEPFSALDVQTRQIMENELLALWTDSRRTVLFVTHNLDEAIGLADEVMLLSAGPRSRVVGTYAIDLPRPRDLMEVRTEPHFVDLYRAIWAELREEVIRSHARLHGPDGPS
jgi:sulfonate transport system ATP-binding protein